MSEPVANSIHKEFELERMILFSDAVFAIAITILIIEIKFPELPENYKESLDLFKMFLPTIRQFLGFILSFFFIGMSWAGHLKLFRYLKAYDNRVIFLNLLSLLFIVAFPFSASGLTHSRPSFMFPLVIYFGNVSFIYFANYLLARYILYRNTFLSIPGYDAEKTYIYKQTQGSFIAVGLGFVVLLTTGLLSNFNSLYMNYSLYPFIAMIVYRKRWLKKYAPKKQKLS